jgi:outer membrane murein-binding lipoprotein Lpp
MNDIDPLKQTPDCELGRDNRVLNNRNAIAPRKSSADMVEVESEVPTLASALNQFQQAIAAMAPDDVHVEIESDRAKTRMRFRAYRYK